MFPSSSLQRDPFDPRNNGGGNNGGDAGRDAGHQMGLHQRPGGDHGNMGGGGGGGGGGGYGRLPPGGDRGRNY